jgi:hypothetical protein
MTLTPGIRTRESPQDDELDPLICTRRYHHQEAADNSYAVRQNQLSSIRSFYVIRNVGDSTTAVHYRASIKYTVDIKPPDKTRDIDDKILLSFSHSKYSAHVPVTSQRSYTVQPSWGRGGGGGRCHLTAKWNSDDGVRSHIISRGNRIAAVISEGCNKKTLTRRSIFICTALGGACGSSNVTISYFVLVY